MKLRKKQSYLNSIPEGSPRKRRMVFLAKILYFLIIGAVIGYIITYFIIHHYLFVFTTGQIEAEKFYVQAKQDCEIIKYYVQKGQKVKIDQPLVELESQKSNDAKKRYLYSEKIGNDLKLSQIEAKIDVLEEHLNEKLKEMQKALLFKSIRKEKENDHTILSSKSRQYPEIKKDIQETKLKIRLLEAEKFQLTKHHRKLNNEDTIAENFKYTETITSHFKGRVDKLCKKVHEYAYRGENVLIIEDPKRIIIKAFFESQYYNYLFEGKQVLIEFPDGKSAYGVIKKIYSTALQNTTLIRATKGSIKIMTDIEPDSDVEIDAWKNYIGMELTIRINRSRK